MTKSYGYDDWGRRTSMTDSGGTTDYAYDSQSRLTSITRTGMTTNSFGYNGFDTRVSKTDSTGTTSYKRAGADVTASLLRSTVSSTSTDYTPGISSRVSSTSTFTHSGLKNSDEQSGSGGTIAASLQYDAFGKQVSSSGTWVGAFKYGGAYGYQTDPDHGLKLLGHRYYEADTGRFLTRDPIKDGRNWYGYCGNGPVGRADPRGLQRLAERKPEWLFVFLDQDGGEGRGDDIGGYITIIMGDYDDEFGDSHHITPILGNNLDLTQQLLSTQVEGTSVTLAGHGSCGTADHGNIMDVTVLAEIYLDRFRGGLGRMDTVHLAYCESLSDPVMNYMWELLFNHVYGSYGGLDVKNMSWGAPWATLTELPTGLGGGGGAW